MKPKRPSMRRRKHAELETKYHAIENPDPVPSSRSKLKPDPILKRNGSTDYYFRNRHATTPRRKLEIRTPTPALWKPPESVTGGR